MDLQERITLSESLIITLFSMGVVIATLIIIFLILEGFKLIFYKGVFKKEVAKKETPPNRNNNFEPSIKSMDINEEIVAIITAALTAYAGGKSTIPNENVSAVIAAVIAADTGSSIECINIKSIKKI
jgi:Na+-transporting methylmalonyl-CoA/oxaloacetate decarboxylase gamma subunit